MNGPRRAAEAFNAYVMLLTLAQDDETLFEVIVQADNDARLSRNQQQALDAVASARRRILGMGTVA